MKKQKRVTSHERRFGDLVTRFAVLFTAGGPAGKFSD